METDQFPDVPLEAAKKTRAKPVRGPVDVAMRAHGETVREAAKASERRERARKELLEAEAAELEAKKAEKEAWDAYAKLRPQP